MILTGCQEKPNMHMPPEPAGLENISKCGMEDGGPDLPCKLNPKEEFVGETNPTWIVYYVPEEGCPLVASEVRCIPGG